MSIVIYVPALPVAQPRHRVGVIAGKARAFAAPKGHPVHAFKATARHAAAQTHRGAPLAGPIALRVLFTLPRPKSKIWKTRPMPAEPHAKKPDIDNLVKAVTDALTGLVWVDDAQICELTAEKIVASGDASPGVRLQVIEVS